MAQSRMLSQRVKTAATRKHNRLRRALRWGDAHCVLAGIASERADRPTSSSLVGDAIEKLLRHHCAPGAAAPPLALLHVLPLASALAPGAHDAAADLQPRRNWVLPKLWMSRAPKGCILRCECVAHPVTLRSAA